MRFSVISIVIMATIFSCYSLHGDDDLKDNEPATIAPAPSSIPSPASADASPAVTLSRDKYSRWFVIVPAFVVHGLDPTGGANLNMPRRLVQSGRSVGTPGLGAEYQGRSGFEAAVAFVKDCYDNPAGAIQIGQHFRFNAWDVGYSFGLYIRETPISCLTRVITTTTPGDQQSTPIPPGLNLGGGRRAQPARTNTLTSTSCAFEDNLPLRYTTRLGAGYMDIIPTPFVHASVRVLHGPFDLWLKVISNFYLNEFGLSIPF